MWVQCVCYGKVFTASGECHVVLLDLSCGYSVFAMVRSLLRQENVCYGKVVLLDLLCGYSVFARVRSLLRQENATLFSWISCVGTVCLLR